MTVNPAALAAAALLTIPTQERKDSVDQEQVAKEIMVAMAEKLSAYQRTVPVVAVARLPLGKMQKVGQVELVETVSNPS